MRRDSLARLCAGGQAIDSLPVKLPSREQADQADRNGDKAHKDPGSVRMRVIGRAEQLSQQPDADGDAQDEAKEVARIVIRVPERRALRQADANRHRNQNKDERRAQEQGGDTQG